MSQPMIVWCVTVAVLLSAFVFRAVGKCTTSINSDRKMGHLFSIGKERDMFYIPGDVDDDDFED